MRRFLIILTLAIGCASRTIIDNQAFDGENAIKPIDSLLFQNPTINFFLAKDGSILVLDGSGEKIFKSNVNNLSLVDTILLPQKINFLKGVATDNFYIYFNSDNNLYRFDPVTQRLSTIIDWKDKINIFDITITSEGEIFVSDNLNNQILLVNSLGKREKFNITIQDLFIPSGLIYDYNNSRLLVINKAQNRIELYSRIGNLESTIKLPNPTCSNVAINQDKIFVWAKSSKNIYYQIKGNADWHQIAFNQPIINIAFYNNFLLLLDSTKGIYIYKIN
jgi:hypothetical protein